MMAWVPLLAMASGIDRVAQAKASLEGGKAAIDWKDQVHRRFGNFGVDAGERYEREAKRAAAAGNWIEAQNWQRASISRGGEYGERMEKQRYFQGLAAQDAVWRGAIWPRRLRR